MDDFSVVYVLHAQAELGEHVQDVLLTKQPSPLLFNLVTQITAIGKIHHNTQFAFFCFKGFDEFDNIRMLQMLNNPRFLQRFFSLVLAHAGDVNDLHDAHKPIRNALDKKSLTERALTQQFHLPIVSKFLTLFNILHSIFL